MSDTNDFLGIGWSFPPTFNSRGVVMDNELEDIEKSLEILFTTRTGERFLQPQYGCDLTDIVHDPQSISMSQIRSLINKAITAYEPRIILQDVTVTPRHQEGLLLLEIEYLILSTNRQHNFVHPFYLNEGGG